MLNPKVRDVIFSLMVFTLIFNNIPKPVQMNFIGGVIGNKLIFFPLLAGIIYTIYCQYKYRNVFIHKEIFIKYTVIYLSITFLSLLVGLYRYPYYDLVLQGPVSQIEKLPVLLNFFNTHGVDISKKELLSIWMLARPIKGLFLEYFYTFGTVYMIFCWYHSDWYRGFHIVCKASICSLIVILMYSSIELFYLAGYDLGAEFLKQINPYVHAIENNGKWWPPLLWKGQLRSVFAEPSYFGIYTAFVLPFLWYKLLKTKKIIYFLTVTIMIFFLVLTKARTGVVLHIGQLFLVLVFLGYFCRERKLNIIKSIFLIYLCSAVGFMGGNAFINNYMMITNNMMPTNNNVTKSNSSSSINNYIQDNALSLVNPDKRSNRARYSIMEADARIGLDYPLLGVGYNLRNAYIEDYLPSKAFANEEVRMWIDFKNKLGILKSGFPQLGEYTNRFAETGILGLLVFLFPTIIVLMKLIKILRLCKDDDRLMYVFYLVSLLGIIVSGIGDILNITFCYWILLSLGFLICFGENFSNKR